MSGSEQGRGPRPSATVLAAIAVALRLTDDEQTHLYRLSGQAVPVRQDWSQPVDSGLAHLLTALSDTTPAFVTDELSTVLAQNWLNITLFGRFAGLSGLASNLVWHWFTSPQWRHRLDPPENHEQTGAAYVADLREVVAERGHDSSAAELIEQLNEASPEFRAMWTRHAVATLHCATKVVDDERVGRIELDCSIVTRRTNDNRYSCSAPFPVRPAPHGSQHCTPTVRRRDLPRTTRALFSSRRRLGDGAERRPSNW